MSTSRVKNLESPKASSLSTEQVNGLGQLCMAAAVWNWKKFLAVRVLEKKVQISNKIMDDNDHKSYLKQSDSRVKCMNV